MLRFWAQIAKISNRRKYPLYGIFMFRIDHGATLLYDIAMDSNLIEVYGFLCPRNGIWGHLIFTANVQDT